MIKGVGPQRAELLAQRGIYTFEDLLGYLPFRYEDRIQFSNIKDIQPNGTYTIRARVMSGQAIPNNSPTTPSIICSYRTTPAACSPANSFTAAISKAASNPASSSSFTAKPKSTSSAPRASK